MSERADLIREGTREDTYILLPGQNLRFECDLGTTSVAGRYRLTLSYKIEKLIVEESVIGTVKSKIASTNSYPTCSECGETMYIGMGHKDDPEWEGFFCPKCGYATPPIEIRLIPPAGEEVSH